MAEDFWVILKADIEDVKNKLDQLIGKSNVTANTMNTNWANVAKGIAASLGIAFSVRTIVNFEKASINAFANAEVSAMVLANTLKNIGVSPSGIKSVEDLISNLEQTKYFDLAEMREALGNAAIKLGDVNLATRTVIIAMEIARSRIIPLSDATQRLSLGLMGNSRGLRDLGINIKDYDTATMSAATQTKILDDVMVKVTGSTEAFGASTKGYIAEAGTAWHDFMIEIGKISAPTVKVGTSFFSDWLRSVTENLKWFEETGKRVSQTHLLDNIVTAQTVQVITDLENGLQGVNDEITKFKPAWATIKIEGMNVPELTKFVGSLSQVARITPIAPPPVKIDISGTLNINMGGAGAIQQGIAHVVKQGIATGIKQGVEDLQSSSHGAGWYSNKVGGP